MSDPDWKALEILITKIQQSLAPEATVAHNIKLPGFLSKTDRQIDVLVKQKIGQYEMTIVIDCKDHASPIDVNGIGEFYSLMTDVKAQKGAMVCPKGFTQAAKNLAAERQIEVYSPIDTDPHKWQIKATAPAICKDRDTKYSFGISYSAPLPLTLPIKFYSESIVLNKKGEPLGTPLEIFQRRWNEVLYPMDSGPYKNLPLITDEALFLENEFGMRVPVDLTVSLLISEVRYFGHVPIEQITGLKDEQTGLVHTREFTTRFVTPEEIRSTWQLLKPEEAPPLSPLFELVMIDGFKIS